MAFMLQSSKLIRRERCPNCAKLGRDTSEDNLGVYDDGHSFCYACEYYRSSKDDVWSEDSSQASYQTLPWRNISTSSMDHFAVRTKCDHGGKPISLGFRYPNGDIKVRLIDHKDFYWVRKDPNGPSKAGLFGRDRFAAGSNRVLIITEGELDALSLWQILRVPVVSVRSSSSCVADATVDRSWCNSFESIYLALDGDAAGREATGRLAKLFDPNKLFHIKFDGPYKDANEYLQAGKEDELSRIFLNAKRYLPEGIISSFSDFRKALSVGLTKGIPYPWPTLTEMTYGIRRGESVLITAPEGIGKSEVMRAIEYNILQRTSDNVGSIFLEELKARHLQGIAGLHLGAPVHLPDSGYSEAQISAALEEAVAVDDRLFVLSQFGCDDPDVLLDNVRFLAVGCRAGVVLLDHIGMALIGISSETDERRKLDYVSTQLELMVKELDFALILVSHVNDEGLTRGSRYISKVADIRIDLSRDLLNPDPIERNILYLKISKNRFSGKTGPAGRIYFDPSTHVYRELRDGETPEPVRPLRLPANDNLVLDVRKSA